jgi:hypothetical protein
VPGLPFQLTQKQMVIAGSAAGGVLVLAVLRFFLMRRRKSKPVKLPPAAGDPNAGTAGSTPAIEAGGARASTSKSAWKTSSPSADAHTETARRTNAGIAQAGAGHHQERRKCSPNICGRRSRKSPSFHPDLRSWIREEEH